MISFNVTLLLHDVYADEFNDPAIFENCVKTVQATTVTMCDLLDEEGFTFRGEAKDYNNQVFDPQYEYTVRKLGQTKGSLGVVVEAELHAFPSKMGYNDDAAFEFVRLSLKRGVDQHMFISVLRDMARYWSCPAVTVAEGVSLVYISESYESVILHSSYPTSKPTIVPRVVKTLNRNGIIAGTIVGVTAFLIFVMVLAMNKSYLATLVGLSGEPHPDVAADSLANEA